MLASLSTKTTPQPVTPPPQNHHWPLQLSVGQGPGCRAGPGEEVGRPAADGEGQRGAECPGREPAWGLHTAVLHDLLRQAVLTAPTKGALATSACTGPSLH